MNKWKMKQENKDDVWSNFWFGKEQLAGSLPLDIAYRADGLKRSRCLSETDFTNSRPFFKPSVSPLLVPVTPRS